MAKKQQPSLSTESLSWLAKGSSTLKASLGTVETAAFAVAAAADALEDLAMRGAKYSSTQSAKSFNLTTEEWEAEKASKRARYSN